MTTYLCGGIAGLTDAECHDWRTIATKKLHTTILNPMVRDCRKKEDTALLKDPAWLINADVIDIMNSDFLLVRAIKPSWGTAMELVYAHMMHKFVVAYVEDGNGSSPWLRFHANVIVTSLEEAINIINAQVAFRQQIKMEQAVNQ